MADGKGPERIQAPGLLEEYGCDLPVSPARPLIHDRLQAVLDSAPMGPGHALVRVRVEEYDRLCPILPRNVDGTFYGATLMALFNISPFLNFLEEAHKKNAFYDPLLEELHGLAESFRGWRKDDETEQEQQKAVQSRKRGVWQHITDRRAGQPAAFSGLSSPTPVPDFIRYLFERIEHAELRQGQGGGDDV